MNKKLIISIVTLLIYGSVQAQFEVLEQAQEQNILYKIEDFAKFFDSTSEGMPTMMEGVNISQAKHYAAHRSLALGTWVKITNLENGHSTYAEIVDRILTRGNYAIELTRKVAQQLKCHPDNYIKVRVEELRKAPEDNPNMGME